MAATQWEAPVTANLRVPINVDSDSYIVSAGGTGTAGTVNKNLNGYWKVPADGTPTWQWGQSLHNLLYLFGIEDAIYVDESTTPSEYDDVQATVTFKDQTLSTAGGGN